MDPSIRAAAVLLCLTPSTTAEPLLEKAQLEARVMGRGSGAVVRLAYELRPDGATEVPISGIAFEPTRLEALRAAWDGLELDVAIDRSRPPKLDARVALPEAASELASLTLDVELEIANAVRRSEGDLEARLPLPVIGWPPHASREDAFVAILHLPAGARVHSAFPSGARPLSTDDGAYRFSLPVVPALLRVAASTGRPGLTLELSADLVTAGLLAVLAWIGWRHFKRLLG